MPNVHPAPAEIRALLRLLTETSTRDGALITATTKLGEALDNARTRRETRELDELTATNLRRNKAIEERNTELYEGWNDIDGAMEERMQQPRAEADAYEEQREHELNPHCRNGHNKRLTRCHCDEEQ